MFVPLRAVKKKVGGVLGVAEAVGAGGGVDLEPAVLGVLEGGEAVNPEVEDAGLLAEEAGGVQELAVPGGLAVDVGGEGVSLTPAFRRDFMESLVTGRPAWGRSAPAAAAASASSFPCTPA